jgi:hypothetical protein
MDWRDRLASINANLDDLQAGVEGGSRAADGVRRDTVAATNGVKVQLENSNLLQSLTQHANDVDSCASHQRGALRELRQNIARLRRELHIALAGAHCLP